MAVSVEPAPKAFENPDAKLAAYLWLLGYDEPACQRRGKGVVFVFHTVVQDDILRFYNADPAYVSPLELLKKYQKLIGKTRFVLQNLPQTVFES